MNNPAIFLRTNLVLKPIATTLMASVLILSTAGNNAYAGVVSQVPLFVSLEGPNPNIMFILDDSGSMQWEVLPDNEISSSIYYMFPTNQAYYGGGWYDEDDTNPVTSLQGGFEDNNIHNFRRRSSRNNLSYYNPTITYSPWVKANGDPFDNANRTCAYHNPVDTTLGCRNFTVQNTGDANTSTDSYGKWRRRKSDNTYQWWTGKYVNAQTGVAGFWPATYFNWTPGGASCALPGNIDTRACYTKVEIRSGNTYQAGAGRSDCQAAPTCTYDEEIQNFANWYTYYRSRILAARAGIGRAFEQQGESLRVGFGAINKGSTAIDGVNTRAIISGVRSFDTENRQTFFDRLYNHIIPASGTPLRQALNAAGQYFSRTDNQGPWCDVPGAVSSTSYGCRRSYTILMTDGYWNGAEAGTTEARDNNDGTSGPAIMGPDGQSYTYSAVSPFNDGHSNTLADVSMYYWKRDLHTGLDNRVPPSTLNPAFWQHMVTFGVGFGVSGTEDNTPTAVFAAIGDSNVTIRWPAPSTSGTTANIDDLLHASVNSRGNFFSAADPDSFATQLSSLLEEIVARESSSASALATTSTRLDANTMSYQAKFDSNDWSGQLIGYELDPVLGTLGDEPKWNTDTAGKIPAPKLDSGTATSTGEGRKIYTIVGSTGKEFLWANLDTSQKTNLKTLNGVVASDSVAQQRLNWIRGHQANEKPSGALRKRTKLLGDIVNSDPFYVGVPIVNPSQLEQTGYAAFIEANKNRDGMLYVGANDGMLHAFNAQTGVEQFAYIPKAVFSNLSSLPDPTYNHKYFVDGSLIVSNVQINGVWKSILIGTTGAGGRSVFALDVTNPNGFDASKVLWEFTDSDLGYTIGRPTIGQLKDGTWVAVFGNGYNSDSGKAFMFVVNLANGTLLAKTSTLVGDTTTPNGLAEPAVLPDIDGKIVAAYAGDLRGNLWKYDLTTRTFAFSRTPLFTAKNAAGIAQPITSAPAIAKHPNSGYLLSFGTGKYFEIGDHSADVPVQSLYGIWDKATLVSGAWQGGTVITARSALLKQEVIGESIEAGNKWRLVSKHLIHWETNPGWYLDLPTAGERITDTPMLNAGQVLFITRIPRVEEDPCIPSVGTSWFMAVDLLTGGRSDKNVFDVDRDSQSSESDYVTVNGEKGVASGFETIVAGMSQATLMRSSKGIQVLLSGTGELSTTASSTSQSAQSLLALVKAAVTAAATSAVDAQAAQAAQAAAQAAQAAADAAPNDPALAKAATDAASAKAAAEAIAIASNTAERLAVIDAAQAIIGAAQAIINAGGVGNISKAEAEDIKAQATAILNQANAISPGGRVPSSLSGKLPPLAARLQGQSKVGTPLIIQTSRESWQQLQ